MNVDLTADDARRLTMLLADQVITDLAVNGHPGGAVAGIIAQNQMLLAKLQPACRWEDAGEVAQALAIGALAQARVPGNGAAG